MGVFDNIKGVVTGGDRDKGMMDVIGGLLGGESGGGLQGLVENFTKGGLGETIGSWIGTGSNLPISADQISMILGNEQVKSIAGKLGISTDDVANKLATMLPQVVDKITPDGKIPEAAAKPGGVAGMLKNLGL